MTCMIAQLFTANISVSTFPRARVFYLRANFNTRGLVRCKQMVRLLYECEKEGISGAAAERSRRVGIPPKGVAPLLFY